jgi:hypothetical protein
MFSSNELHRARGPGLQSSLVHHASRQSCVSSPKGLRSSPNCASSLASAILNRGARPSPRAKRYVVGLHDLADLFKVRVEKVLLMMRQGTILAMIDPPRLTIPVTRFCGQWAHSASRHACMDGEIINPLLSLRNQHIAEEAPMLKSSAAYRPHVPAPR